MRHLFLSLLILLPLNMRAEPTVTAMLLTGQMNKYHNWEASSVVIEQHLKDSGVFTVDRIVTPPQGADMRAFAPDWSKYDVVVLDYDGDEWPVATKSAFVDYIRNGGGLVSIHSTDNAFPHWPEFNEMIGLGGWGGRDESWGPKVRWHNCEAILDDSPGVARHPKKHDFLITVRDTNHPITNGMPENWLHANDELYSQLRGPAKNLHVLATGFANPAVGGSSGENEPVLFTINYGKGRIFHNTLGHVGKTDDSDCVRLHSVGYIATLQRGTEWAATGKVTQKIPEDFPSAYQVSVRPISQ